MTVKKNFYWPAVILSAVALSGYFLVGSYIFELKPTGEVFDTFNGATSLTPFIYVDPVYSVIGVAIECAGLFLYCTSMGILIKFCKLNLSCAAKIVSVSVFALVYLLACCYLFFDNFTVIMVRIDMFAVKEIWANAVNFLMCISSAILGFCSMYKFKNESNYKIYV